MYGRNPAGQAIVPIADMTLGRPQTDARSVGLFFQTERVGHEKMEITDNLD